MICDANGSIVLEVEITLVPVNETYDETYEHKYCDYRRIANDMWFTDCSPEPHLHALESIGGGRVGTRPPTFQRGGTA